MRVTPSMERLVAVRKGTRSKANTALGAISYYNKQNPGVLPFLVTAAMAGCTNLIGALMNSSEDPSMKAAAVQIYVVGNSMSAFGAVGSIGAFIYGQARKDEIPVPVLRDYGGQITRTFSHGIKHKATTCMDGICSFFRRIRISPQPQVIVPGPVTKAGVVDIEMGRIPKGDAGSDAESTEGPGISIRISYMEEAKFM